MFEDPPVAHEGDDLDPSKGIVWAIEMSLVLYGVPFLFYRLIGSIL